MSSPARDILLAIVQEVEKRDQRVAELKDEVAIEKTARKAALDTAKTRGLSVRAIEHLVAWRAMTADERAAFREIRDLSELYAAALGGLDGTPLGDSARDRLRRKPEPEPPKEDEGAAPEEAPPEPENLPASIEEARDQGRTAFAEGADVLANPFVAGDPRRAAWDEGWCEAAGSDGMDIPEAWRRSDAAGSSGNTGGKGGDGSDDDGDGA